MAIVFDPTIGGDNSTSYVTVAEFNTYVEKLVHTDDLPKPSQTTLIKKLLIAATEAVDATLRDSIGWVTNNTQRLEYPRTGITDRRGYSVDENTLPQELIDAVSEMAIWLYLNDANNVQHDDWSDSISSIDVGGAVKMSYGDSTKPSNMIPERVKFLLSYIGTAYVRSTNRVRRS